MKAERVVFYLTWVLCAGFMVVPSYFVPSTTPKPWFTAAWLLLLIFGIIQIIRTELAKGERHKAIARGECPTCGYTLKGLPSATCPECGEIAEAEHA